MEKGEKKEIEIRVTDDILMGRYANIMRVGHSADEFVLEFANALPPKGIMVSRVVLSPGHLKRMLKALNENLKKYEDRFGEIREAIEPKRQLGF